MISPSKKNETGLIDRKTDGAGCAKVGARGTMAPPLKHFIDTQDFSLAELKRMLELTRLLKEADKAGACPKLLAGASLGMIFEEPSTRTRVSFEVAMTKLGGHALYLRPGEIHLGQRENIRDTAKVISRMVDVIEARTLKHKTVLDLAANATVPVLNGLTDFNHPTQVVCDVFTMMEHKGAGKELSDLRLTFIGDATNVCSSLLMITTQMGMHFTHAAPKRYQAPAAWQEIGRKNAAASGGSMTVTEDLKGAVRDADFVYTDLLDLSILAKRLRACLSPSPAATTLAGQPLARAHLVLRAPRERHGRPSSWRRARRHTWPALCASALHPQDKASGSVARRRHP